jgi:hypothetical protein
VREIAEENGECEACIRERIGFHGASIWCFDISFYQREPRRLLRVLRHSAEHLSDEEAPRLSWQECAEMICPGLEIRLRTREVARLLRCSLAFVQKLTQGGLLETERLHVRQTGKKNLRKFLTVGMQKGSGVLFTTLC